ncbi:VWA domain-containing protein [bacterium]|nr:VWA domain-containing protein [bacterium]
MAQTNDPPVTSTTQITPTMTCTNKLDIMLVLDGSGSISANDFRQVRDFSSRLAESFTIGDNATRIGIVQFSDNAQLELPLSVDIAQVQSAIQQVQQIGNGTEIGAGITLAQSEIEANGRADATPILILLTDGRSSDPVPAAQAAQRAGTRIVAVGVGGYDIDQLQAIASDPKDQSVFTATSFDVLANIDERIVNVACNAASRLFPTFPRFPLWVLLCLPLLLLPIPLILLIRAFTQRSLRNAPLPPTLPLPPVYAHSLEPTNVSTDPLPVTPPPILEYHPALLIGLGKAGRWTLTHVKSTLHEAGGKPPIGLIAFDVAESSNQDAENEPIAVRTATLDEGIISIQLQKQEPAELHLLANTPAAVEQFVQHVQAEPDTYPILTQWLSTASAVEQHTVLRLQFLTQLREIAGQLLQSIRQLQEHDGKDIFLVASLEEDIGLATMLDCTQLVQLLSKHLNLSAAIHLWIYTPTRRLQYATVAVPAAWTVVRTLERLQTCFAHQPATPPLFDWHLAGLRTTLEQTWNEKLTTSCTIVNSDRYTNPLSTIPPQNGLYVMVADAICALLEVPAAHALQAHRANVNSRIAQYQQELDVALYSSWGAFTYLLRPAALVADGAAQIIMDWHDALLGEYPQSLKQDLQVLRTSLNQSTSYGIFDVLTSQESLEFSTLLEASELLEPTSEAGKLALFVPQTMPNAVRRTLALSPEHTLAQAYFQYTQDYADEPNGLWFRYLDAHATNIPLQFQHRLIEYVLSTLNGTATGRLAQTHNVLNALRQHIQLLQQRIEQMHNEENGQTAFHSDQLFVEDLSNHKPNFSRRITGHVTSPQQDALLIERYDYLTEHLATIIAERIGTLCNTLSDIIQRIDYALSEQIERIQREYRLAQADVQAAHLRRLEQIERSVVQHEWGLPHTAVLPLRQFLDPSTPLPNDVQLRRHVQKLREYVNGQHIQHLWNLSSQPPQNQHSLSWAWDDTQPQPCMLVYTPPASTVMQPAYRVPNETSLRQIANATYAWVWTLNLVELLSHEQDDPDKFAAQLDNERAAPPVIYRPTLRDRHELHTFVITTPAPDSNVVEWLRGVVVAQQKRGLQHASHRVLNGSNPYRLSYLPSYEIIGAIGSGALPDYDWLKESYQHYPTPVHLPLARQEQLAVMYEQQDHSKKLTIHPNLSDVLFSQERLELFAKALLVGAFSSTGKQQIVIPSVPSSSVATWIDALRWLMYGATEQQVKDLSAQVSPLFATVSEHAYEAWLTNGIPALLKQSDQAAERDLAQLLQLILDPFFYSPDL